jgi:hypothetical protein
VISGAVEGPVDEAVFRRLVEYVRAEAGPIHGKNGKALLQSRINGYNNAARFAPWFVLVDLDRDADCAPSFVGGWLRGRAPRMCFRVAGRAVEAWLLGDRERMAAHLHVDAARIPVAPELLDDPKRALVDLARHSRRRDIREDMVPRAGSGRTAGPAYTSRLIEFIVDRRHGWRPGIAARSADSLKRSLQCLRRLTRGGSSR